MVSILWSLTVLALGVAIAAKNKVTDPRIIVTPQSAVKRVSFKGFTPEGEVIQIVQTPEPFSQGPHEVVHLLWGASENKSKRKKTRSQADEPITDANREGTIMDLFNAAQRETMENWQVAWMRADVSGGTFNIISPVDGHLYEREWKGIKHYHIWNHSQNIITMIQIHNERDSTVVYGPRFAPNRRRQDVITPEEVIKTWPIPEAGIAITSHFTAPSKGIVTMVATDYRPLSAHYAKKQKNADIKALRPTETSPIIPSTMPHIEELSSGQPQSFEGATRHRHLIKEVAVEKKDDIPGDFIQDFHLHIPHPWTNNIWPKMNRFRIVRLYFKSQEMPEFKNVGRVKQNRGFLQIFRNENKSHQPIHVDMSLKEILYVVPKVIDHRNWQYKDKVVSPEVDRDEIYKIWHKYPKYTVRTGNPYTFPWSNLSERKGA